jgi:hypothetical protein
MDELEEKLKKVLKQEADRIEKPIKCNITGKPCRRCQPYCTHRRKEEVRLYGRERGSSQRISQTLPKENEIREENARHQ